MNFQYLEHLEVEILNSNFKLKDSVFSVGEISPTVMKKKLQKKTKAQRV